MKHMWNLVALLAVLWPAFGNTAVASVASSSSQPPVAAAQPGAAAAQTAVHKRLKILLLQGANLSYLGRREPELYGTTTAAELDAILRTHARTHGYDIEIFYTHVEGEA